MHLTSSIRNLCVGPDQEISDISAMPHDAHTSIISRNLRDLLDEKGLKPTPLSLSAGLSRSAIGEILSGKSESPKFSTLEKIAEAAGVDVRRITVGPLGGDLSAAERRMLDQLSRLDEEKRQRLLAYLDGLVDSQS